MFLLQMTRTDGVQGKRLEIMSEMSDGEIVEIDTPANIQLIK